MIRTFSHADVEKLASTPRFRHQRPDGFPAPLQILGDLMTVEERLGKIDGMKIAYLGDATTSAILDQRRALSHRSDHRHRQGCPPSLDC